MFEQGYCFVYRALTGLHCGAAEGESGLDLPVVRERITRHPIIPGSSLKGVWRDYCADSNNWEKSEVEIAFGSDPKKGDTEESRPYSGCLSFNDAGLLFLPVRASQATFVLVTCPLQIRRYFKARELAGLGVPVTQTFAFEDNQMALVRPIWTGKQYESAIKIKDREKIYLEDLMLTSAADTNSFGPPGLFNFLPEYLLKRIAMVSDPVFQWLAGNCLEVAAHNVLDDRKKSENLWYEEVVPAESVFFQLILSSRPMAPEGSQALPDSRYFLDKLSFRTLGMPVHFFQVGGHETKGRGLMKVDVLNQRPKEAGGE